MYALPVPKNTAWWQIHVNNFTSMMEWPEVELITCWSHNHITHYYCYFKYTCCYFMLCSVKDIHRVPKNETCVIFTVVSLLQWNLARDILMTLAIKRIHLPPHLSYVSKARALWSFLLFGNFYLHIFPVGSGKTGNEHHVFSFQSQIHSRLSLFTSSNMTRYL